jgi:hypothetical protein
MQAPNPVPAIMNVNGSPIHAEASAKAEKRFQRLISIGIMPAVVGV